MFFQLCSERGGALDFPRLFGFITSSPTTRLYRGGIPKLTSDNLHAATHDTERGDYGVCLCRSHYTDTDPTSRERVARAVIKPRSSSPGVARSTAATPPSPAFPRSSVNTSVIHDTLNTDESVVYNHPLVSDQA